MLNKKNKTLEVFQEDRIHIVLFGCILLVLLGLMTNVARAVPNFTVSVNNTGSTTLHEITLSPGDAFSVDLNVTTNEALYDISMYLRANTNDVFDITDGSYHSPWDVSTNPIPVGGLDPQSSHVLLGSPGGFNQVGPGNSKFATLDLLTDSSASLGEYTINVTQVHSLIDPMIPGFYVGNSGPDFIVNVIPEPATITLLGAGIIGILSYRKRK
jgi:hypothetical protein